MKIPVGDLLRSVVKGGFWRKLLDAVRGVEVKVGGTTVVLDENQGSSAPGTSPFDRVPHQPGPDLLRKR
jgi:hypothetical protein